MQPTQIPRRPRLTPKILFYAIFDVVGMVMFAAGVLWLTQGTGLFVADFPADNSQAIAATAGGVILMFWAATQILRELIRRPTANPGRGS
jgi:formate hydrogenlyase subunit 3/multisubunit Na+/H+ antiporter MnhD subunit